MWILLHFNSPSQFYDKEKQLNVDKLGHHWEFASVEPSKSKKVDVDVKTRFVFSNHSPAFNLWQRQQKSLFFIRPAIPRWVWHSETQSKDSKGYIKTLLLSYNPDCCPKNYI